VRRQPPPAINSKESANSGAAFKFFLRILLNLKYLANWRTGSYPLGYSGEGSGGVREPKLGPKIRRGVLHDLTKYPPCYSGERIFFYNYMLLSPSTATEYLLKALGWTSVRFPSHTLGSLSPPSLAPPIGSAGRRPIFFYRYPRRLPAKAG
jgi:hypothetical protein